MPKKKELSEVEQLVEAVVKGMQEKKGHGIVTLNLKNIDKAICDYYVICHGDSNRQVDAIADSVDEIVKKELGEDPWYKEGFESAEWILLDYVNVIVHVFKKEMRDFYDIEGLWADAETKQIESQA